MNEIHVFTSSALNYIPKVRILFDSIRKFHPEWKFHLALSDEIPSSIDLSSEGFDSVVAIDQLEIPNWKKWTFCHNIVELSTAIKPFMFKYLQNKYAYSKAFYFDPDTVLFSRVDDLVDALDAGNILLTPHQTEPEESLIAVRDNEISSLKHGVFNLGLNASGEAKRLVDWWSDRLYHFCIDNIPQGIFTDQRWMDLVPCFFDGVIVSRSPRYNVATWNLTTRTLTLDDGQYCVDGQPLGFYHFTGFDSGAHHLMAVKVGAHHAGCVNGLLGWYADKIKLAKDDPLSSVAWRYGAFSDGSLVQKEQRVVFRLRSDLWTHFDDPFDAKGFAKWWNEQGPLEFPGLFAAETKERELTNLKSLLPAGFIDQAKFSLSYAKDMLLASMTSPAAFRTVSSRALNIIRREGLDGVVKRLR
jgi:hypothetical protein